MVRSGLALAGANHASTATSGDDGRLTALEKSHTSLACRRRARMVIVDGRGAHSDTTLQAGCEVELIAYRCSGQAALEF
jgi:hypothetical protein